MDSTRARLKIVTLNLHQIYTVPSKRSQMFQMRVRFVTTVRQKQAALDMSSFQHETLVSRQHR